MRWGGGCACRMARAAIVGMGIASIDLVIAEEKQEEPPSQRRIRWHHGPFLARMFVIFPGVSCESKAILIQACSGWETENVRKL